VGRAREGFAASIVKWQGQHGRHDLPWQNTRDPYRVWLSEIMLQQTQVQTVRDYFVRFLQRFPDLASLAHARLDDVLGLWSGLGYYSRARNLHRCAQQVLALHGGVFPQRADVLVTLPGIGRSTAAAIASLCFGERVALMDANVRRVVARVTAFDGDVSRPANERLPWDQASALLPQRRASMPAYSQGMMDLGASICLQRKPLCERCPVREHCEAARLGTPQRFPAPRRKALRGSEHVWLLWLRTHAGAVVLARRPQPGVWGGLHCLPLFASEEDLRAALPEPLPGELRTSAMVKHALTHKDMYLHVLHLPLAAQSGPWGLGQWHEAAQWPKLGLPAPIRKLLDSGAPA
jgi:A/G-specific adenine glycosylase